MTEARYQEILKWADPEKWPRFEMVIYKNRISLEECLQFLANCGSPKAFKHVLSGTEYYFNVDVKHEFVNHSSMYVATPKKKENNNDT